MPRERFTSRWRRTVRRAPWIWAGSIAAIVVLAIALIASVITYDFIEDDRIPERAGEAPQSTVGSGSEREQ